MPATAANFHQQTWSRQEPAGMATADYGLDHAFRDQCKPLLRFLFESYWRVRVTGQEYVPSCGGAILVGNHSGALPFDGAMLGYAVDQNPGRIARALYHRFVDSHEPVSRLVRRLGAVPARYAVADELLTRDELVAIFPEGVDGVAKTFADRYRLRRFATSAARLSCDHRVPIVPFTVVGAEEIYPIVGRSNELGRAVSAPYVPMTPLFPLLGPLGLLPLPTRWTLRFGPRIYLYRERRFQGSRDYDAMAARLRHTVQLQLHRQMHARESIFLG